MYSLCHCGGCPRESAGACGVWVGMCFGRDSVSADGESCGEGRAPGGRCWLCGGYRRDRAGVPWRRRTRAGQVGARRQRTDAGPCCAPVLGRRCVPTGSHVARVFRSSRRCVLYLQTWGGEARAQPCPSPLSLGPASLSLSQPLLIPHRTSVSAEPSVRDTRCRLFRSQGRSLAAGGRARQPTVLGPVNVCVLVGGGEGACQTVRVTLLLSVLLS